MLVSPTRIATLCVLFSVAGCKQEAKDAAPAAPSTSPASPSATPSPERPAAPATSASPTGLPAQSVGAEADCSAYSVADIEGIWGAGVQPPAPGGTNKVRQITGPENYQWTCKYDYDSASGLTVSLEFRVWPTEDEAKQDFARSKQGEESMAKRAPDPVAAGDEGFVGSPMAKDINRQIYVRKGRVRVLFSATNLGGVQPDYTDKLVKTFKLRWP